MKNPKKIAILGSTGSIGKSTLDIVRQFPSHFQIEALTCHSSTDLLFEQIQEFQPSVVCISSDQKTIDSLPNTVQLLHGQEGLTQIATLPQVDIVVAAIMGVAGARSTYSAIEAGKTIALANKESLVLAGDLMMKRAKETGSFILPMDSEHNGVFQTLQGHRIEDVRQMTLTASGGAVRDIPLHQLQHAKRHEILQHPTWEMGDKITVDSATMMNKGLEIIEAAHLFGIPAKSIQAVMHRDSIVHSLVEYIDGSIIAQMSIPDMRLPIGYCLSFPERLPLNIPHLQPQQLQTLHFEPICSKRYPCFQIATDAASVGGFAPAVLNGANECVVQAFLDEQIHFKQIAKVLQNVMQEFINSSQSFEHTENLECYFEADNWGRSTANSAIEKLI